MRAADDVRAESLEPVERAVECRQYVELTELIGQLAHGVVRHPQRA